MSLRPVLRETTDKSIRLGRSLKESFPRKLAEKEDGGRGTRSSTKKRSLKTYINLKVFDMFMSDEIMVIYKKFSIDAVYGKFGW
ncbi:unnamed protein product [Rhizophagus irregularis]|nr:unnamed protein product [Rhizophagus irregularis]